MPPASVSTSRAPIGVFDSGLGGLTVVRALRARLPAEAICYLGDTARVPYGAKSAATVARYSLMSARFLLGREVKLLVIACNTASAYAVDVLRAELPVPVLGVIEPGAEEAIAATHTGRIGVIGTLGTVRSGSYPRAIAALDPRARVTALACPLFVPLVEEGWLGEPDGKGGGDAKAVAAEHRAARATVERYLGELHAREPELDVLVLGCTHYPLLRPLLSEVVAELWKTEVKLVDSAQAMARAVERELGKAGLLAAVTLTEGLDAAMHNAASHNASPPAAPPDDGSLLDCFVTDETRFAELGARFLGHPLDRVERVDL